MLLFWNFVMSLARINEMSLLVITLQDAGNLTPQALSLFMQ